MVLTRSGGVDAEGPPPGKRVKASGEAVGKSGDELGEEGLFGEGALGVAEAERKEEPLGGGKQS